MTKKLLLTGAMIAAFTTGAIAAPGSSERPDRGGVTCPANATYSRSACQDADFGRRSSNIKCVEPKGCQCDNGFTTRYPFTSCREDKGGSNSGGNTEASELASIRAEIAQLESETQKCESNKKKAQTATWIGVGVTAVGGTVALIQNQKVSQKSKELETKTNTLNNM